MDELLIEVLDISEIYGNTNISEVSKMLINKLTSRCIHSQKLIVKDYSQTAKQTSTMNTIR